MKKKRISILGSTGSIGVNTLKVVKHLKDQFEVINLSCNQNIDLLIDQIKTFQPKAVSVLNSKSYYKLKNKLKNSNIEILKGKEGLLEISSRNNIDLLMNGLVGAAGMKPTLNAINQGIDVALSNKESLVMAGSIIKKAMKKSGANLFPVDSEHSAIWQCLIGEDTRDIRRLILTGSGGPFRTRALQTFNDISLKEALNHPNWDMGRKISIDSATMMNKGFELIEAYWLFDLPLDKIDIVVHPQSIIHSMVEFKDSSIKAQLGVPDMKVPIQYALTYPRHVEAPWERLNFFDCKDLSFQKPDYERFPCISLALESLDRLGTSGTALNISNDYTVSRFLNNEIKFTDIAKINKLAMRNHAWIKEPNLEDISRLETWVKDYVYSF
ncbi:MAG: 1-deoxy-D-xylulose-5-phosphate reductoisomerase [Candidatus Neomarinimicrobiota bacterium]|nr:1-deoxy-D-xylulose-5-phosphate reductoisomerase [Candidatus Neomarinimicrobiota bacterium]